ncbi:MAG: hypothetical protein NTX74_10000 [Flavobacterium sp.]|nr:hypothetical protein [Flavobacterium sp.]
MENHYKNIRTLIQSAKEKIGKPVSIQVVAATIESLGIRDKDIKQDYGFANIPELAALIFKELIDESEHSELKNAKEIELAEKEPVKNEVTSYLFLKIKIFFEYYTLGLLHLLPVFIQIATIILFGYSLWTWVGFNPVQSTAVVLGVIVGLVSTGGYVQVIGKQASFYWNFQDYEMVRKTINFLHKVGILTIFAVLGVILLVNFFFHLYPFEVLVIIFTYAFLIGTLLLMIAPFHTIKQRWVITVAIMTGTTTALFLKNFTDLTIYQTHWIGISIVIVIAKLFLIIFFQNFNTHRTQSVNTTLKIPVVLYHNYQYFFYGLVLYGFFFIDRILAWSSGINGNLPFLVYFEKDYELGMDLAILIFLLLAGVLEYAIASFTSFMDVNQKTTDHNAPELFNSKIRSMYWEQVSVLFITSLLAFAAVFIIINASWGFTSQFHYAINPLSLKVCVIGGLGYILLAWGMLNALYLFTLGQTLKPLKALLYSALCNLIVGFILSRFVDYEYSVVGLLVGAGLFAFLTVRDTLDYFKNLDYYYYAAY